MPKKDAYIMEKGKLEKNLLENEVAMEAMMRFAVDMKRTVICLSTDIKLCTKTNKELVLFLLQKTMGGGRVTDKLLNHISSVYLGSRKNLRKLFKGTVAEKSLN